MKLPEQIALPVEWNAAHSVLVRRNLDIALAINRHDDAQIFRVTSTASNYTATLADSVILVTAAGKTITLPAASTAKEKRYTVKNAGASVTGTTINAASGNIDGSASYSLSSALASVDLVSDGTNYWAI